MLTALMRWFESRLDTYPQAEPEQPPKTLLAFCLHYSKGAKRYLFAMALLGATIAALEITLFGFMGSIVDWLSTADPTTFLADEGWKLAGMAIILLLVLPLLQVIDAGIIHQTLLGNFPQRIRWMAHRYLIRQSMSYFQDEFAGRIGAKLMQTALAVREVVMKLLDVTVFVVVYFAGAVVLAAMSDIWLAVPFLVWLVVYVGLLVASTCRGSARYPSSRPMRAR
jgi:ATP-binding cassette subfamily B multidrug efflux pump